MRASSGFTVPPRQRDVTALRTLAGAVLAALLAGLVLAACVPTDTRDAAELDDGSGFAPVDRSAPVFPADGPADADLLVTALVFDLTDGPVDRNVWVPDEPSATCAAQGIVDEVGVDRLTELGYRPDTPGRGLNQLELTAAERSVVAVRVAACLDLRDALGTLLMGNDQMTGVDAACIADSLEQRGLLVRLAEAYAFGDSLDPLAGDGVLADGLLDAAQVCIGTGAFDWTDAPSGPNGTTP